MQMLVQNVRKELTPVRIMILGAGSEITNKKEVELNCMKFKLEKFFGKRKAVMYCIECQSSIQEGYFLKMYIEEVIERRILFLIYNFDNSYKEVRHLFILFSQVVV